MRQHRTQGSAAALVLVTVFAVPLMLSATARAQPACSKAVIFTTPGVTWRDVQSFRPSALLALAARGALGSMSVHTDTSRPTLASAFTTLGAGARMPAPAVPKENLSTGPLAHGLRVATPGELHSLSTQSGYGGRPGALAGALKTPVVALGDAASSPSRTAPFAQWTLLAAMEPSGRVAYAATGADLLEPASGGAAVRTDPASFTAAARKALSLPCATVVIDAGDLTRTQEVASPSGDRRGALLRTDDLLRAVAGLLDLRRDQLLVISPTSPLSRTHLGIAVAVGPSFRPGSLLESASTRRAGIVTLPDVAPTVLAHFGIKQPAVMDGQPFFSVAGDGNRVADAVSLDREAVFVDASKPVVSWIFLGAQLVLFGLVFAVMWLQRRRKGGLRRATELVALVVAALPVATFLTRIVPDAPLGRGGFIAVCLVVDVLVVGASTMLRSSQLGRLGAISGLSLLVITGDLLTGGHLQLNSLLGDSPLIAGRFSGAGNNAFAIMAATAVVVATLLVWRYGSAPSVLAAVAGIFVLVVIVDGAPQFGSDVGGVLSLVPGFAVTWVLLSGKRISLKVVVVGILAAAAASALFLAVDLSRPPQQRTHLGRFFEDVRARGSSAFFDTIRRKASSNLRQARSFQNLYRFLPAAVLTAVLLLWPARWRRWFRQRQPVLRAGLWGGLIVALLGSGLNDSGITIFTTMLLYLTPMAILVRLRFLDASAAFL